MPEIQSEDGPAHPRIERIFKDPRELEIEELERKVHLLRGNSKKELRAISKKSDGSGGKCQNYSNAYPSSLTFSTAAH